MDWCGMSDMTVNISVSQSVPCLIDMGYDNECIPGFVDGFGLKIDHTITHFLNVPSLLSLTNLDLY